MTNNDILRRLRFTFEYNDAEMIKIFESAKFEVTRAQVSNWLKREDDLAYQIMNDKLMAIFLNGMIVMRRGKKEEVNLEPETRLNNNIIFRKLKIALNLKDDDVLDILASVEMNISKHELSAFFRNPSQQQYRPCNDQVLRNFLQGLQKRYHD